MPPKTIGVLGGMGPDATALFFQRVIALTPAQSDQEHIPAVGRTQPNAYIQRMVSRRRNLGGSQPLAQDARSILLALRRNATIGLLADHYLSRRHGGLLLPFLGTAAWSNPGPATLALRTGCPLLLAHTHRLSGGRHRIELEPRLELPTGAERQANIAALTDPDRADLCQHVDRNSARRMDTA